MHINKPLTDLKFNVAQLLREDIGGRRSYTFQEEALLLDEETMLRKIVGEVRFTRTASGVLADADVRGVVETQCIRCLTAVQVPLELAFRDEFHSMVEVNTGSPLPKPAEDDPFFINENHLLDLGEAIREYGLIEMPMRPLCREDCKGLCPQCGVDRNTTQCSCSDDDGDDRLSVLQQLLDKNR
ncbi:DUF177 domain-containing protein [Chloroflexia bacterium SDU3-3]|nr:DUF177 domain-containing protein [Chloroflexia bacterium SDU3-3]